jgi:hypothetical protein
MKYLLSAVALMFALGAHAEAETKKSCIKDNAGKEVCKTIKVHKKAEKVTDGNPTDPVKKEDKKKK